LGRQDSKVQVRRFLIYKPPGVKTIESVDYLESTFEYTEKLDLGLLPVPGIHITSNNLAAYSRNYQDADLSDDMDSSIYGL